MLLAEVTWKCSFSMIRNSPIEGPEAGLHGNRQLSLDFEIQEREFASTRKNGVSTDQNLHRQVVLGGDGEETLITTNVRVVNVGLGSTRTWMPLCFWLCQFLLYQRLHVIAKGAASSRVTTPRIKPRGKRLTLLSTLLVEFLFLGAHAHP